MTGQVDSYNVSKDRTRIENTDTHDISYRFGCEHARARWPMKFRGVNGEPLVNAKQMSSKTPSRRDS